MMKSYIWIWLGNPRVQFELHIYSKMSNFSQAKQVSIDLVDHNYVQAFRNQEKTSWGYHPTQGIDGRE